MKKLNQIWKEIARGENIDLYATVAVAFLLALANVFGFAPAGWVSSITIALLGLIAVSSLVSRHHTDALMGKLTSIIKNSNKNNSAEMFFLDRIPSLHNRLLTAKSISISGITLSRTSNELWKLFQEKADQGDSVRILIVDPNHAALELSSARFEKHQDPFRLRREVEQSLDNFMSVSQEFETNSGFQVRLMPFVPAFGIWIIDGGTPDAEIWVEIYTFRAYPEPSFHLTRQMDGKWFDLFSEQFEKMWSASSQWNRPSNQAR